MYTPPPNHIIHIYAGGREGEGKEAQKNSPPAAGETPDPANAAPSDTQHLQTPNTWPCAVGDVLPVSHVFIRAQCSDHNHPQMAPASVLGALRARM